MKRYIIPPQITKLYHVNTSAFFSCDVVVWLWNQGNLGLTNLIGNLIFSEFVLDRHYFLLKCLLEFTSEIIWALSNKIFIFSLLIFLIYKSIQILFLLESVLVNCVFLEIFPFYLSCPMYCYKAFHDIPI